MHKPQILITTVGTSLLSNLENLSADNRYETLRQAYQSKNWCAVASELAGIDPSERVCGAEINSISDLQTMGYVQQPCGVYLVHSDTQDGRDIVEILKAYHEAKGHAPVRAVQVEDLQDDDPKRFRTKGLRSLARHICKVIHEHSPKSCAINATGGYKAQIAIAVLLGQAIGVPVYYKHERFSEIICFPPMPVSLDYEFWMRTSGILFDLEKNTDPALADFFKEEWDEKLESLVERVTIDGQDYLELSATGQIFHETFRERFRTSRDQVLPPEVPATEKCPPRLEQSGWPGEHPEVRQFMERVTYEVPQVKQCATHYYNPDLPERTRFRVSSKGIEGVYSDGRCCVKFRVDSSARNEGQANAVVAKLNEWLADG